VLGTEVRLHRSGSLRALTAEARVELTDTLDVSALLTSQDNAFRNLPDCVHNLMLLSIEAFRVQTNPAMFD
jgi:hypothetical protein